MNVYDEAHNLARAIKESNEFKEFDRMRHEIEQDEEASKMIGELQQLQVQLPECFFGHICLLEDLPHIQYGSGSSKVSPGSGQFYYITVS